VFDDCVDLFGSEAAAGKSLGTDLAKGKLTLPVLLVWERAEPADREHLEALVQDWQPGCMEKAAKLLAKYETLSASLQIVHQYLGQARQAIQLLPNSLGRSGLLGLTDYLAQQSATLGTVPEDGL
jgi:octaprenyl-diphosphate synthase